jgi:hypothetical protein
MQRLQDKVFLSILFLGILFPLYAYASPSSSIVPEPTTLALLATGLVASAPLSLFVGEKVKD